MEFMMTKYSSTYDLNNRQRGERVIMNETQRSEVNEIVKNILLSVPALQIYLFGSFAKGNEYGFRNG